MPRRTTRKNSSKPKPAANKTGRQSRVEQRDIMLTDFDSKVKQHLRELEKQKKAATLELNKSFDRCLAAIPSEVRHLTLKEFAELGGTYEDALAHVKKAPIIEKSRVARTEWADITNFKALRAPATVAITSCEEEEEKDGVAELKTVQTAIKRGRPRRAASYKTPAITPKFDPKLELTPENTRDLIPGEMVMSMRGTPVKARFAPPLSITEEAMSNSGISPNRIEQVVRYITSKIGKTDA